MTELTELPVERAVSRVRASGALGQILLSSEVARQHAAVNEVVVSLEAMEGVSVDVSSETQALAVLGGKASVLTSAAIHGARHKSLNGKIDTFMQEKALRGAGKFGIGTYFGLGVLNGESVDLLATREGYMHEASIEGNFLLLHRDNFSEINTEVQELVGHESLIRSKMKNDSRFSGMVSGLTVDADRIDGIVIFMDGESAGAELIVLPDSTDHISIDSVSVT